MDGRGVEQRTRLRRGPGLGMGGLGTRRDETDALRNQNCGRRAGLRPANRLCQPDASVQDVSLVLDRSAGTVLSRSIRSSQQCWESSCRNHRDLSRTAQKPSLLPQGLRA